MKKTYIKYYIILGLSLVLLITYELMREKTIDWTFTLEREDKIPYGTYVLYNTLEDIFPEKEIQTNRVTLYQYKFKEKFNKQNFIFVSQDFKLDDLDSLVI